MQLNEQDVLVDIAIGLYKREQVSLGRAAEIANVSSPVGCRSSSPAAGDGNVGRRRG
jgi:hypothetical protein